MTSCDAIVIGGGPNGLAAAGRLAKAGRSVILVERNTTLGGGAASHEIAPGFKVSSIAHTLSALDPRVEAGLDLAQHGLSYAARALPTTALDASGDHLRLEGAFGARILGRIPDKDRRAWAELRGKLLRFATVIRPLKDRAPPKLKSRQRDDLMGLAKFALRTRRLGRDDMREFLRMLLINVADVLNDELSDSRLKGVVAFDAVLGAHLGPRSPNTLLGLIYRLASEAAGETAGLAVPKGGMGAVAQSMAGAIQALGVQVLPRSHVRAITIENDRATGVELTGGGGIRGRTVVSAIDPRTTLLDLVTPRHLDTETVRRTRNIRARGACCKLHIALNGAPDFRRADLATRLVIAPSIDAIETAFDAVKYGRFSSDPVMEIVIPSATEAGHAPDGRHVLSAIIQYAPYNLRGGWHAGKAAFLGRIMSTLETYAPGLGKMVEKVELLTPPDLERTYGFAGGNWHHAELSVEQMLFLRPAIGLANYETPIEGLYLAGAGSHPGGGISGAAGWNAAEHILAREGR